MNKQNIKLFGLAITCFSLGTIIQIFVPDIFIVLIFACILLVTVFYCLKAEGG